MNTIIRPVSIEAFAYRVPTKPIKVSFGTFRDRPMVLVRIVDSDGADGWGEVWCNWPAVTAEHRARLATDIGERLIGRTLESPDQAFHALTKELEVLALQTGEYGPIQSAIAGIDIALWDLAARKAKLPLYRALGAAPRKTLPVYATGINPDEPEKFAAARYAEGHRAFKLKTGFGHDRDIRNLRAMREALGPGAALTCDANQALTADQAIAFAQAAAPIDLQWFEEAIRVDAPLAEWKKLAAGSPIPLAGGENFQGTMFDDAIRDDVLKVFQPDVTKWGGVTGNFRVGSAAVNAGKRYCPHFFAGGVALLASLHCLTAAGGTGLLEFDCWPNPNRELVVGDMLPVTEGSVPVPQGPGLGAAPDVAALAQYRTWPAKH
jgi:L-alanine-DL-glutamate epimerase-like enolase superfamily enzyme